MVYLLPLYNIRRAYIGFVVVLYIRQSVNNFIHPQLPAIDNSSQYCDT